VPIKIAETPGAKRGESREERGPVEAGRIEAQRLEAMPRFGNVGLGRTRVESPGRISQRALGEDADLPRARVGDGALERALIDDADRALHRAERARADGPEERIAFARVSRNADLAGLDAADQRLADIAPLEDIQRAGVQVDDIDPISAQPPQSLVDSRGDDRRRPVRNSEMP